MERLIVLLIVVSAAAYLGRKFYRNFKNKGQCGCGCSACDIDATICESTENKSQRSLIKEN